MICAVELARDLSASTKVTAKLGCGKTRIAERCCRGADDEVAGLEAAEIIGICDRTMRRMREKYQEFGYTGLFDHRRGKRSIHRVPMETAEEVLRLYGEMYFDLNIRHFHEKLRDDTRLN